MKIAIIGTRGIPAKYGGFETFAEEISKRLVISGFDAVVYGRSGYYENSEKIEFIDGVKSIHIKSPKRKQFETI